jgi:hypothetical protein
VSDDVSRDEQSNSGAGGALRIPRLLALGATVTVAVFAGRMLLERRRADDGNGGSAEAAARDVAEPPADLATELRGAAAELAVTLLDRATEHLERAKL